MCGSVPYLHCLCAWSVLHSPTYLKKVQKFFGHHFSIQAAAMYFEVWSSLRQNKDILKSLVKTVLAFTIHDQREFEFKVVTTWSNY